MSAAAAASAVLDFVAPVFSFSRWSGHVDRKSLIRCAQRLWRGGIQQDFAAGNATVISCSCVLVLTRSARMTCRVAMRASRCHFDHASINPNCPCVCILAATLPFSALRLHAQVPHSNRPFLIQIPHILSCTRLPSCCRYCSNCMVIMDSPTRYPSDPLWKYPEVCRCHCALLLLLPLHPESF